MPMPSPRPVRQAFLMRVTVHWVDWSQSGHGLGSQEALRDAPDLIRGDLMTLKNNGRACMPFI
jgi:hypothetical protein